MAHMTYMTYKVYMTYMVYEALLSLTRKNALSSRKILIIAARLCCKLFHQSKTFKEMYNAIRMHFSTVIKQII